MATSNIQYIKYQDTQIPVKISLERRMNAMISIGRQYVYLRIPAHASQKNVDKHLAWAENWIKDMLEKKPDLLKKYQVNAYENGRKLLVNGVQYVCEVVQSDKMEVQIKLKENNVLSIKVPVVYNPTRHNAYIQKGLSRIIASQNYQQIVKRIHELNKMYFGEHINDITIKYNKSNWGSCSRNRNINISSRVLFAPPDVQDYIFIHELTHLKEMNHSSRFWDIVKKIMPDYKEKEKWLKKNNSFCDF